MVLERFEVGEPYLALVRIVISFIIIFLEATLVFIQGRRSAIEDVDLENNRGRGRQQNQPQSPDWNLNDVIEMILEIVVALS